MVFTDVFHKTFIISTTNDHEKLHSIEPRKIKEKRSIYSYSRNLGFVLKEDIIYLDSSEIAQTIFWKAEVSNREWVTSEIIVGNRGMLDTLQNFQYLIPMILTSADIFVFFS